jgi:hypothetical protein
MGPHLSADDAVNRLMFYHTMPLHSRAALLTMLIENL